VRGGGRQALLPKLQKLVKAARGTPAGSAAAEACFELTGEKVFQQYLGCQLKAADPEVRAFTSNSLVGIARRANIAWLVDKLREAVAAEQWPAIKDVMKRDLETLLAIRADLVSASRGGRAGPSRA
jgi:hypothetical protein